MKNYRLIGHILRSYNLEIAEMCSKNVILFKTKDTNEEVTLDRTSEVEVLR